MSKKILLFVVLIFALATVSASAQDLYKSRPFPIGNVLSGIQERAENLVYISEEDWDVNAFVIGRNVSVLNAQTFKQSNPKILYETVEDFPVNVFWERLEQKDYSWTRLRNYLEANLAQIHIFKVGDVRRDVYVVGIFDGHIVGVRMFAVETWGENAMKIQTKIFVIYDCRECGERCETETDFPWIDETSVFKCDFCGATSKIQIILVVEKKDDRETFCSANND